MRGELETIHRQGAAMAIIGSGTVAMARDFEAEHGKGVPVFSDPGRASYQAAELKRGLYQTLAPGAIWRSFGALFRGFAPGAPKGDALQQGGVLVISKKGELLYRYEARHSGDHPPIEEIHAALKAN